MTRRDGVGGNLATDKGRGQVKVVLSGVEWAEYNTN